MYGSCTLRSMLLPVLFRDMWSSCLFIGDAEPQSPQWQVHRQGLLAIRTAHVKSVTLVIVFLGI